MNTRYIRLIGLTVFALLLVSLLHFRRSGYEEIVTKVEDKNQLINVNNEKVDAAINNEISKLNHESADDANPKDALTNKEDELDVVEELIQIRSMGPMTIFSKTYCPFSKRLKKLLSDNYQITPEPIIVELDKHSHGQALQEYLGTLTGRSTVPNVLIGPSNESKGGADDFIAMHKNGELLDKLRAWGDKSLVVKKINAPSNM